MTTLPSAVICAGCGAAAPPEEALPVRCPNAGRDDVDHVMQVVLDARRLTFPGGSERNPFVRYRTLLHSYHLALRYGMTDADYVALVGRLDDAVARVDGRGFTVTTFGRQAALSDRLGFTGGGVWVKDETGNVSGSHKARHLMGVLIYLELAETLGLADRTARRDLAIASCGNAALAAAVVAKAGGRRLHVFVPPTADPTVLTRLEQLGAIVTVCPRDGEAGDPTYRALRRAVAEGAFPFTCQGPDNGLTIEGGKTLAYEMVSELLAARYPLDRVCVQVGGGALASAVMQGLRDAVALGALPRLPRMHAVQTQAVHPLKRAYDAVAARIFHALPADAGNGAHRARTDRERAALVHAYRTAPAVTDALLHAAAHRGQYMRPWDVEPASIAHGIIDDETYDWLAVVDGMVTSGGHPVVVSEDRLEQAHRLAQETTGINVDPTGAAGLAGLLELLHPDGARPHEHVAVLFTGVQR